MRRALVALGYDPSPAAVSALFESFDRDGGGSEAVALQRPRDVDDARPVRHRLQDPADRDALRARISGLLGSTYALSDPDVQLVPPGTLETTGSGKLRRLAIRQQYLSGTIPVKRG